MGAERGWREAVTGVLEEEGGLDEYRIIKEERSGKRDEEEGRVKFKGVRRK